MVSMLPSLVLPLLPLLADDVVVETLGEELVRQRVRMAVVRQARVLVAQDRRIERVDARLSEQSAQVGRRVPQESHEELSTARPDELCGALDQAGVDELHVVLVRTEVVEIDPRELGALE